MTNEQPSDFMRAAGFVPLIKYERVHPSFDRARTWGHRAVNSFIEITAHENYISIERPFTPKRFRRMEFATRLLTALCAQADKDSITLKPYATNWLGADPFDLVKRYRRFGFVSSAGDRYAMERKPR